MKTLLIVVCIIVVILIALFIALITKPEKEQKIHDNPSPECQSQYQVSSTRLQTKEIEYKLEVNERVNVWNMLVEQCMCPACKSTMLLKMSRERDCIIVIICVSCKRKYSVSFEDVQMKKAYELKESYK